MNDTKTTGYAPGELVNVRIDGVRYGTSDPGHGTRFDLSDGSEVWFWLKPAVPHTIERVAPKEWPPQPGDVWVDGDASEWFAFAASGKVGVVLRPAGDMAFWATPGDLLTDHGPVKLVRRRGWTPDQPSTVDQPEPDERAAWVAGVRALADLIESRPEIPAPYSCHVQYSIDGTAAQQRGEALLVAGLLGVPLDEHQHGGDTVLRGEYKIADRVEYVVYARLNQAAPEPAETDDEPVEVAGA